MRFKRGVIRKSCDFCRGRRLKCDREERLKSGALSCTQCERRRMNCDIVGDLDIRRSESTRSTVPAHEEINTHSPTIETFEVLDQILKELAQNATFPYDAFDHILSEPLVFEIFEEDHSRPSIDMNESDITKSLKDQFCHGVSQDEFNQCYDAYFDYVNNIIPVLNKDRMYGSKKKEVSLILQVAIAYCGAPFSGFQNFQQLQTHFAEAFLDQVRNEGFQSGFKSGFKTLDALEAMTIMYSRKVALLSTIEGRQRSILQDLLSEMGLRSTQDLARLLVSSLDSMQNSQSDSNLSIEFIERKTLVSHHIFALSSFEAFDGRCIPCIRPNRSHLTFEEYQKKLSDFAKEPSKTPIYIQTIFLTASFAHRLASKMLSPSCKALGIPLSDIFWAYDLLSKSISFLQSLHPTLLPDTQETIEVKDEKIQRIYIVHLLLSNLVMQFVSLVDQFGIRKHELYTLQGQVYSLHINALGVQVASHICTIASACIEKEMFYKNKNYPTLDRQKFSYSYMEVLPCFARDIMAGTCVWLKNRFQNDQEQHAMAADYERHITILRSAISFATTYPGTKGVLLSIDNSIV